ncbi:MAG: HNH endonuclease [Verrucomicrobia bacterium]|nr:HNH endonuclease [Verrucomicrobiota bacterium]
MLRESSTECLASFYGVKRLGRVRLASNQRHHLSEKSNFGHFTSGYLFSNFSDYLHLAELPLMLAYLMKAKLWYNDWKQQLRRDLEVLNSAVQAVHLSERARSASGRITIPSLEVANSAIRFLNQAIDCVQKLIGSETLLSTTRIVDGRLLRQPQKTDLNVLLVIKKVAKTASILRVLTDDSLGWVVCSGSLYSVPSGTQSDEACKIAEITHRKFDMDRDHRLLSGDCLERRRTQIPEAVRHEVWRRDQGKCVECDSVENLEYDHLVPFSKGGSNTARNLRLLCERCNRAKSDSI